MRGISRGEFGIVKMSRSFGLILMRSGLMVASAPLQRDLKWLACELETTINPDGSTPDDWVEAISPFMRAWMRNGRKPFSKSVIDEDSGDDVDLEESKAFGDEDIVLMSAPVVLPSTKPAPLPVSYAQVSRYLDMVARHTSEGAWAVNRGMGEVRIYMRPYHQRESVWCALESLSFAYRMGLDRLIEAIEEAT